jgi:hypothetical protein
MRRFTLIALALCACTGGDNTSSRGQMITCTTDPGTGVILSCGTGSGSGGGGNTCQDIDEDGDGEPHDQPGDSSARLAPHDGSDDGSNDTADDDGDGIPNSEDCDTHEGEDDGGSSDGAQLPYDIAPQLGATATPVVDAFASEGAQPASIVSVTGATWRAAELSAGTPFVITQADCDHQGTRAVGRDRVVVTWTNADGTTASDHLDIRYCNAN